MDCHSKMRDKWNNFWGIKSYSVQQEQQDKEIFTGLHGSRWSDMNDAIEDEYNAGLADLRGCSISLCIAPLAWALVVLQLHDVSSILANDPSKIAFACLCCLLLVLLTILVIRPFTHAYYTYVYAKQRRQVFQSS